MKNNQTLEWVSPNNHRILLMVDGKGRKRSNSPVSVNIDFPQTLDNLGAPGAFDEHTIEVAAYDPSGKPKVFDPSRAEYEKYLLPWRIDKYYGVDYVTLNFVMPDDSCNKIAVYFDTKESGLGKPKRYHGLVGDGDYFRVEYSRREIGASHMDCFCDFDGDGDLDLFKVTTEPFIYCYENVGGNKFVERGKLTSGGSVFTLPMGEKTHRSWATITFHDWNGNGHPDLFASICDGDEFGQIIIFENVTKPGGQVTFANRGRLLTESGKPLGDNWFGSVTVVDWDGDGTKDILVARTGGVDFYKNLGDDDDVSNIKLADAVRLELPSEIEKLSGTRAECVDIDGDGDLDLFITSQGLTLYFCENVGTRTNPIFQNAAALPSSSGGHCGIKVADFDGDGLLDYVTGCVWESQVEPGERRLYARMYKNVGTPTEPKFEERNADNGAPYTEQFQICEAGRQNTVHAVDWDNDGRTDLLASNCGGSVLFFRNTTNNLWPVFADGERVLSDTGPDARSFVCDWNNDGKKDIVVTNRTGEVVVYLNEGTDDKPKFGEPVKILANGKPISGTHWCSVLVCDWDNDGKKDLIMGMGGEGKPSLYYDWPHINPGNPSQDLGLLFYKNIGTDAEPVLAYPKWITCGPGGTQTMDYMRPNVGSYVDWDGDGKKDLIACEFEHIARFYKNTGSGGPNQEPQFAEGGVEIVRPWTVMTISGADAVDWNGDGDLDIVTGQGHGGSGLRFYERDYIEDYVHKTFPMATVERYEKRGK
ncbi:MAG: VCBS repeat-containing protein [Armatimonadota bacterium]|nr:VCBS repeat-containing protein [Armatimonadota bacterium]